MQEQKNALKKIRDVRSSHDTANRFISKHLIEYENVAMNFYSSDDPSEKRFTHEKNSDITERIDKVEKKISNPYK